MPVYPGALPQTPYMVHNPRRLKFRMADHTRGPP